MRPTTVGGILVDPLVTFPMTSTVALVMVYSWKGEFLPLDRLEVSFRSSFQQLREV